MGRKFFIGEYAQDNHTHIISGNACGSFFLANKPLLLTRTLKYNSELWEPWRDSVSVLSVDFSVPF